MLQGLEEVGSQILRLSTDVDEFPTQNPKLLLGRQEHYTFFGTVLISAHCVKNCHTEQHLGTCLGRAASMYVHTEEGNSIKRKSQKYLLGVLQVNTQLVGQEIRGGTIPFTTEI